MNIQFIITGDDGNMYDLDALSNTDLTMICKTDLQGSFNLHSLR